MKALLQFAILVFFFFKPVFADTSSAYEKKSSETQALIYFDNHIKKDLGYLGAKIIGFNNGKNAAMTAMIISENKFDFVRSAEISPGLKGASVSFRTYRNCVLTNENSVTNLIVSVDNQNIQFGYFCIKVPGSQSVTQEIYITLTPEGQEYIQQAFRSKKLIFVKLIDGFEFPFVTEGFAEAWKIIDKPAL